MKDKYCIEAIKYEHSMSRQFLVLAEYLYHIRNNESWKRGVWKSFNHFCQEFNSLSQATVSKLISIHEKFVLEYQIDTTVLAELGWSKLAEIIPLSTTETQAKRWVKMAKILSREEIRKAK